MLGFLRLIVPDFIRRSYALKFGIVLLFLGLSVGAIGFVATNAVADSVEENAIQEFEGVADQEASAIESWDRQNRFLVRQFVDSTVINEDNIGQELLDFRNIPDTGLGVHFVNYETGEVAASTTAGADSLEDLQFGGEIPENATDQVVATEPYVIENASTYPGSIGDDNTVVMMYIQKIDDHHAIFYEVNLDQYTRQFQSNEEEAMGATQELAAERQTIVTDSEFGFVMDDTSAVGGMTSTGSILGQEYGQDQIRQDVNASMSGSSTRAGSYDVGENGEGLPSLIRDTGRYDFEPDDGFVVGWQQVDGLDWIVFVHTSRDDAMGFVQTVESGGRVATGAGVLLIFLFGIVLGRNTAVSIDRLTSRAEEMEQGNLDVDFETNRIDNIGRLYQGFASMRDALSEQIREAEQAREEAESERERVEQMNDELERAAQEYCDVMGRAADGDLTVRADVDTDNEQMVTIGEDFNAMLDDIEATIEQLKQFASEVATSSEEVTASSEEVKSASEQVSESVQEISDGAERQNKSLQSVNQEMDGLSTTIEEIAASSNEVADIAARTAETGREGREAAENAIAGMNEVETEASQAVDEIERLEEEVAQIDELIDFIAEIAEQTNMLALNANIEAARSTTGEEGEGFGVVAEEVKELSEDAKEAAEEIEQRLEGIRQQTERSADGVQQTSSKIAEQTGTVQRAAEALDEIAGYAEETNTGVQEISAATEEQAASTEEVVAMVDEAATISEETTTEAENVAAAAEEQTTAMTEVSQSASNLAGQAARLSEALDRFETDVDVAVMDDGPTELADETEAELPGPDGEPSDVGAGEATEIDTELGDVDIGPDDDTDEDATALGSEGVDTDADDLEKDVDFQVGESGAADTPDAETDDAPGQDTVEAVSEHLESDDGDEETSDGDWGSENVDLTDVDEDDPDDVVAEVDDTIDEFDEEEDPFTFGDPDDESVEED